MKAYRCFLDSADSILTCLGLNIKYWSSPDLNSMRWLGLFTTKTFRKHIKLIFPHRDFIICIASSRRSVEEAIIGMVSLAIFHPHFSIRIFPSAFFYPPSAIRRHPVRTLQRPDLFMHVDIKQNFHGNLNGFLVAFSTIFTSYLWRASFRTFWRLWYSSKWHFLSLN